MLKNRRRVAESFGLLAVLALFAALLHGGAARADEGGAKFAAQSRVAGPGADKADALEATPDPAPSAGAATNNPGVRIVQDGAVLAAYDCPTGATACFYTGTNGTGLRSTMYGCGFAGLGGHVVNESVYSLKNQSSGVVSLYNWTGHGYELKGWVYPPSSTNPGTGNFPVNVGADVVNVFC